MDKFTKMDKSNKKEEDNIKYNGEYINIISDGGWEFVQESDSICVLPIIVDKNEVLLRMEVIPSYQYRDGKEYHVTCISGTLEEEETPELCITRELEEEAGLVLRDNVVIEILDSFYKSKSQSSKFYLCILPLSTYQYDEVIAKGDGSKHEELSKTVTVSVKDLNKIFPSDIVTKLLIEEGKKYLNIQ